jgi:DNA repair protein RecN (Recombination protein N)
LSLWTVLWNVSSAVKNLFELRMLFFYSTPIGVASESIQVALFPHPLLHNQTILASEMLVQLDITDFAIIKHLEITLKPGLNILSGETGAGKSIIINAMNLILGGRASADLIRGGCTEARVEALFSFPDNRPITEMLSDLGLPFDRDLLIKRTVSREGRNRISINGSMATLQMLTRLSSVLISVSGQHEHQLLLKPENHLLLLDDFGGLAEQRAHLAEGFERYQAVKEEIRRLKQKIRDMSDKQELARFQRQEIEGAKITPGEDEALAGEKKRLQHAEDLLEIASEGFQTLYESNDSVLSAISQLAKKMDRGADLDPRLGPIRDRLRDMEVNLDDLAFSLRDFRKSVQMDPQRLEEVLERLEFLNKLKRKYGPTLSDVLQAGERISVMVVDLDEKNEEVARLEKERQDLEAQLLEKAHTLSAQRKKTAVHMERAIEKELQNLHMNGTRFSVRFEEASEGKGSDGDQTLGKLRAEGFDHPEFLISPNVGEELRPLSRIASGGELSRILLAIKTILAATGSVETIIFDEVDAGISGATAEVVGKKVLTLAQYHQILCITHLPQIACQGQTHFLVKKAVNEGRTQTVISELDAESRVQEIARLLGGERITESAVAHAKEMLGDGSGV